MFSHPAGWRSSLPTLLAASGRAEFDGCSGRFMRATRGSFDSRFRKRRPPDGRGGRSMLSHPAGWRSSLPTLFAEGGRGVPWFVRGRFLLGSSGFIRDRFRKRRPPDGRGGRLMSLTLPVGGRRFRRSLLREDAGFHRFPTHRVTKDLDVVRFLARVVPSFLSFLRFPARRVTKELWVVRLLAPVVPSFLSVLRFPTRRVAKEHEVVRSTGRFFART